MRIPRILYGLTLCLPVPAIAWAYQAYRAQLPAAPGQQLELAPKPKVGVLDVLTADRRASIWHAYAREVPSLMERLASADQTCTLVVPVDTAVVALPYKPHQAPSSEPAFSSEGSHANSLAAEELRSASNAQRWLEGYIIAADVALAGAASQTFSTLQEGRSLTFALPKTREAALKGWTVAASDAPTAGGEEDTAHVIAVLEGLNGKVMLIDRCVE